MLAASRYCFRSNHMSGGSQGYRNLQVVSRCTASVMPNIKRTSRSEGSSRSQARAAAASMGRNGRSQNLRFGFARTCMIFPSTSSCHATVAHIRKPFEDLCQRREEHSSHRAKGDGSGGIARLSGNRAAPAARGCDRLPTRHPDSRRRALRRLANLPPNPYLPP